MKDTGQLSQFVVAAATIAAGILNKKLGLDIQPSELVTIAGVAATFIAHRHFAAVAPKATEPPK